MDNILLRSMLKLAEETALRAGCSIKGKIEIKLECKLLHDIKIEEDFISENIIINALKTHSNISIYSEEQGFIDRNNDDEYFWIVDPLDGTLNYYQEIPFYCISIGLWKGKMPILGVIYDFYHNETFSGIVGEGAWLNNVLISSSDTKRIKDAVLCTGFPVRTDFSTYGINKFIKKIQAYRKVRLLGSAALSLAYVACGRVDVYKEDNIMLWDIGAGCAIVKASGGKLQFDKFDDIYSPIKITANNHILRLRS